MTLRDRWKPVGGAEVRGPAWLHGEDLSLGNKAPHLGLWPSPSRPCWCGWEALPVHPALGHPPQRSPCLLLRKWPPSAGSPHARVRLEGLHGCFDRSQVSRAQAATPQAPQTPSDLTPMLYLVPCTPTLLEALLCLNGSAPCRTSPLPPRKTAYKARCSRAPQPQSPPPQQSRAWGQQDPKGPPTNSQAPRPPRPSALPGPQERSHY